MLMWSCVIMMISTLGIRESPYFVLCHLLFDGDRFWSAGFLSLNYVHSVRSMLRDEDLNRLVHLSFKTFVLNSVAVPSRPTTAPNLHLRFWNKDPRVGHCILLESIRQSVGGYVGREGGNVYLGLMSGVSRQRCRTSLSF